MGKIYSTAGKVVAWLGPANADDLSAWETGRATRNPSLCVATAPTLVL